MATRSCSAVRLPTSRKRCSRTGRSSTPSRTSTQFPASQVRLSRWRSIRPCRANNLKELVAYAKANPGKLSYGSAGTGSLNHLTAEAFKLRVGLPDLIHVPYRGAGPAIADILAGQIPMIVPAMTNIVLELHRAGKLRVLAVTHGTRLAAAPELPTAVEQGLTDLVAPNFVGVFAPTGTPKPIIDQVAQANLALLADHGYRELLVIRAAR